MAELVIVAISTVAALLLMANTHSSGMTLEAQEEHRKFIKMMRAKRKEKENG